MFSRQLWVCGAASVLVISYGIIGAARLHWLCDDIFITFRYARNILAGNGWVYNVGERVEGYTHFLWLCIITCGAWLGGAPEFIAQYVGMLSYALTIVVFLIMSFRIWADKPYPLPLTCFALAIHYDFKVWATSGLETSFFTMLMVLAFYVWNFSGMARHRRYFIASVLATLVVLTRPDGVLFLLVLAAFAVAEFATSQPERRSVRDLVAFALPPLMIYVPYIVWKMSYYGDFFPNTYYAKSGGDAYWSQGFYYAWQFATVYPSSLVALVIPVIMLFLFRRAKKPAGRAPRILEDQATREILFLLLFVGIYLVVFVARVGGDFMFGRFLHPVIPFAYYLLERSLTKMPTQLKRFLLYASVAFLALVAVESARRASHKGAVQLMLTRFPGDHGILDERWYWNTPVAGPTSRIEWQTRTGKQLRRYFDGRDVTLLLAAGTGIGYYSDAARCIERNGLTDRFIARLPLVKRGRPGHEKTATAEYLCERRVHFFIPRFARPSDSYRQILFRGGDDFIVAEIVTYDKLLLQSLKSRFGDDVRFTDFGSYLDAYIADIGRKTADEVARDLKEYHDYYFRFYPEDSRQEILMRHAGPPHADLTLSRGVISARSPGRRLHGAAHTHDRRPVVVPRIPPLSMRLT